MIDEQAVLWLRGFDAFMREAVVGFGSVYVGSFSHPHFLLQNDVFSFARIFQLVMIYLSIIFLPNKQ